MNLRNCKKCGKLHCDPGPVCRSCLKREEEKFEEVKAYLKEYPNSPMTVVAQETGVTISELERYLREGRLEATVGIQDAVRCIKCGKPIIKGRYCAECERKKEQKLKGEIQRTVNESRPQPQKPEAGSDTPKMHYQRNRNE